MTVVAALWAVSTLISPESAFTQDAVLLNLNAEVVEGRIALIRARGNGRLTGGSVEGRLRNDTADTVRVSVNFTPPLLFQAEDSATTTMVGLQVFHTLGAYFSDVWGPYIALPPGVEVPVTFVAFGLYLDRERPSSDDRLDIHPGDGFPPGLLPVLDRIRDDLVASVNPDEQMWDAILGAIWMSQGNSAQQVRRAWGFFNEEDAAIARRFLP